MRKQFNNVTKLVFILIAAVFFSACATSRPVLYPNEHAKEVGNDQVYQDINECMRLAKSSGAKSNSADEIAKETAGSATEGAATGAATGAVIGDSGTGAAMGAIRRGMNRFFAGMHRSKEPSPAFKQIVERCLIDKGYEPIGWK